MTKNEALLLIANRLMEQRLKPMIDKALTVERTVKPIKYNAALDENDYAEYITAKEGKLTHIHNKRKDR